MFSRSRPTNAGLPKDELAHGSHCGAFLVFDQNLICFVGVIFEPFIAEISGNRISVHNCDQWTNEIDWLIEAIQFWLEVNSHETGWRSKSVEWAELDRDQIEDLLGLLIEARDRGCDLVSFSF